MGDTVPVARPGQIDETVVFAKTQFGVAEVSTRSSNLTMTERRVLILVDGRRNVVQLAPAVRPGEIGTVLQRLETLGMVRRVAEERGFDAPPTSDHRYVMPGTDSSESLEDRQLMTLETVKRRAVRELSERLGPDGETMAIRIEHCRTVEELRERLREAERLVAGFVGDHAALEFVRAMRRR